MDSFSLEVALVIRAVSCSNIPEGEEGVTLEMEGSQRTLDVW